jgi:hypothetical protein
MGKLVSFRSRLALLYNLRVHHKQGHKKTSHTVAEKKKFYFLGLLESIENFL